MHAVVRSYSGAGATELVDRIVAARDEIQGLIGGVQGFVSYTLVRAGDGFVTVTVCQDKAGTDQSVTVARDWIAANASDIDASAPAVSEGAVDLSF
ncbi:MAG: hypothetical protein M3R48_09835 [Candidatus Dormibacteraeota bacterium]|nr:hypothetical protein [Candidatus Dormibacteraeota bacterium]